MSEGCARVFVLTPPMFDALPLKAAGKLKPAGEKEYAWFSPYANYDETLGQFADWSRHRAPTARESLTFGLRS